MITKTEIVERAVLEVLGGGTDPSLTDYEQRLYWDLVEEIRQHKPDPDMDVWRLDYIKKPPSMEQFLMDEEYLGNTWKPVEGENEGIWPAWQEIMNSNLDIESRIHNMVITGSLGIGKTVMMVTALLYRICVACHLKNPQHFFGLNKNTNIVYNFLSITKTAVKETGFGDAMSFMGDSPFFVEFCGFDPESDYSGFRIPMRHLLPNGRHSRIWVTGGSKGQHVLGRNLLGIGLDEGNFRLEKDPDLKAYDLYDEVRTRIANRFQKIASYLPAISIIASSAQDESSFTEKIVAEIEEHNRKREQENEKIADEESKMPVTQAVFRNAVYKIKRHTMPGIGPDHHWFRVAYGLKNMEPYILSGWYREDGAPILDEAHEEPPSGAKTELAPKFYWEAYKRNCKTALQNLSGISVGGAHRLFPSLLDIETCLTASKEEGVPNPMLPGVQRIPISSEDNHNIWDSLNHKAFLTRVASRIQPLRHPQNKRYAHIDLATQTLAGVAICHLAGAQLVEGLVRNGEPYSEYRLMVEYDFILTICAGQNKPINIEKIQRFFFWLRDMCGYRFGLVTADMWNSAGPLQAMEARGYEVDTLSIDRDKSVYYNWRTGFEEHRIRLYRNEDMIREAEQLLEMDKKFDHPSPGCFTGDTTVKLLNGTVKSLAELAQENKSFWIYASNGNGAVIPAKARAARKTKSVTELVEITLDNKKVIRCTPDHKFMLRTGSYCSAKDLLTGYSLMPLHTKLYKVKYKRGCGYYEQVWSEGNWRMTHKLVASHCGFAARSGEVIHHTSLNSLNNDPDYLERLTVSEHNRRHVLISKHTSDPEVVKKRIQTFKKRYSNNPEFIAKKRELGRQIWTGMTPQQKANLRAARKAFQHSSRGRAAQRVLIERNRKRWSFPVYRKRMTQILLTYARSSAGRMKSSHTASQTNKVWRSRWTPERLNKHVQNVQRAMRKKQAQDDSKALLAIANYRPYLLGVYHAIHLTGGGGNYTWHRRLKGTDWATNAEKLRGLSIEEMCRRTGLKESSLREHLRHLKKYDIIAFTNHKVVSTRTIQVPPTDVYDISVPGIENFALAAGVFVHNSKDTADAASGAFWNAVNSEEKVSLTSHNAPSIYTAQSMAPDPLTQVPIAIPLPAKGYDRSKVFDA